MVSPFLKKLGWIGICPPKGKLCDIVSILEKSMGSN